MSDNVLFVDDEPAVLDGYRRLLGREISVATAAGGREALNLIGNYGPYGVVVSDMRMPEMDGAHFLAEVRSIAPTTVRMALTGYTDIDAAIHAVNEGQIFRFMTKPCSREDLLKAVHSGLEQHHLFLAEKELLDGTLRGCVSLLSEMLSFSNPAAFGRAMRLRRFVQHAAKGLYGGSTWKFEIAAMLSQLGCVTLNPDLVIAAYSGEHLSPEDRRKYEGHAAIAGQMLSKIPRMEAIAQMVAFQNTAVAEIKATTCEEREEIERGIQLLRVGLAYDEQLSRGLSSTEARRRIRATMIGADPSIIELLVGLEPDVPMQLRECGIRDLSAGMILQEDLFTKAGLLIAAKGQELSYTWIERLQAHFRLNVISGPLKVQLPKNEPV
jgi:CheY-like chemotaxis protein